MTTSTAASGVQGTVKWFSNKKGFGFIAPTSDNTPTQEEIFVHQTAIVTDGHFRTLSENSEVKFDVEKEDETGKLKAINVTNVDGSPIVPPPRQPRRNRGKKDSEEAAEAMTDAAEFTEDTKENTTENGKGKKGKKAKGKKANGKKEEAADGETATPVEKPPKEPPFHANFAPDLKKQIEDKGLILANKTTVDVALGDSTRIKLGQGGYAGMAMSTAVIGEGKYECSDVGVVTFTWERSLKYEGSEWKLADVADLISTFSLTDDTVGPVKPDETAATLWGEDKPEPKEAFEANGFQMRRVVLTRPPGRFGGRNGRNRRNKKEEKPAE